jgi:hypothetical protein
VKSSFTRFNTQSVYGLTLPQTVKSTQWNRKAQIAGASVPDVRLVIMSWMESCKTGPFVSLKTDVSNTVEVFRSRMKSMVASTLFTEMHYQKDDVVDLTQLLKHFTPTHSSFEDFTVKQQEPFRTRARVQWRLILSSRGTEPPPNNFPLLLYFLNNAMFHMEHRADHIHSTLV